MSQINQKNASGLRIAQIVLGVIAIGLSISVMIYPGAGMATIVFLLAITLLVAGFERIVNGIFPHNTKSSRLGNIVLGLIAVGLGIAVIVYPVGTTYFLVSLLAVGLLFLGIARIIQGFTNKHVSGWARALAIGVGILCLGISFAIFASPLSGAVFLAVILGVCLLIVGIEAVVNGVSGRGNIITSASNAVGYGK
jgi:uncharacterized membrane protein HdeD (DUF308 family)